MNKSESIKNLAAALNKAQAVMGGASKAADNPFFRSKYADLSEVVKAIKEPFAANGLSYSQFPIEENGRIGIETILMHSSGEWLEQKYTVPLDKQNAQGAGSALTYCRRYALQAITGVPAEDDDGNNASDNKDKSAETERPWYNEPDFQADLPGMTDAIRNGMPVDEIISQLQERFKISKEMREKINAI